MRRPGGEAGPFLQRYKLSAYPTEANLWAPGGGALILQSARPVQFAAGAFDDIVCANNPSVSRSADTSPYTGEALGGQANSLDLCKRLSPPIGDHNLSLNTFCLLLLKEK